LILVVGLLAWGSRHPIIAVSEVEVNGTKVLSKKAVKGVAEDALNEDKKGIFSRKNIFLYPRKQIESGVLKAFPRAMTASVSLSSIKDPFIVVAVEEREPHSLWCGSAIDCYFVDKTGFVFAEAEKENALKEANVFTGGLIDKDPIGSLLLPNHFLEITKLVESIEAIGVEVVSVNVLNDNDFSIMDESGMELRMSFSQSNEDIISNLKAVLGSKALREGQGGLEYIDLRFGKRVYYRFNEE